MPSALLKDRFPIVTDTYDPKVINAIIDILEQTLSKTSLPQEQTSYAQNPIYNMDSGDQLILVDYTATGAVTVNLVLSKFRRGASVVIKDSGASAGSNNITINASGSDLIDGSSSITLDTDLQSITLMPDGGQNWYILAESLPVTPTELSYLSGVTGPIQTQLDSKLTKDDSRVTGKTAAATILTATVGAADAAFMVLANIQITVSTVHSFGVIVTYTDETNTSRTETLTLSKLGGTLITAITNTDGVGPYTSLAIMIRAKAATNITVQTSGTFTTVTYNAESSVIQLS